MEVPPELRAYACDDYFASPLAETGWWDAAGQCWYIEPSERIREDHVRDFLVIGTAGSDGIEWGYRKNHPGIWAYYPIDDSFVFLTDSATALRDGYSSGQITV